MTIFGLKLPNFFPNFFAKISRVSVKARKTRLNSNFGKTQFPKLEKMKISAKAVFRRALHTSDVQKYIFVRHILKALLK